MERPHAISSSSESARFRLTSPSSGQATIKQLLRHPKLPARHSGAALDWQLMNLMWVHYPPSKKPANALKRIMIRYYQ